MSWSTVKLGDVCEIVMGQAPAGETYNNDNNGFPLIAGAGDFKNGIVDVKKFTTAPTKLSKIDDIVLSIRASIGDKVWSNSIYCLGRGVAALRVSAGLEKDYLWHTLSHVEKKLAAKAKGATFKQVNREDIHSLKIPLPPLAQQKRIAAILDKADEIKRKREQAIAKLDQLAQSIFVEMFGDMVSNNKQWDDSKLLDDVAEIVSGITKGRKLNGATLRSIPYLAVLNVQDKSLNLSVIKTIEATEAEINRLLIRNNDLLLTEGGDADKLGRGTLWNNELPECIHQNHIFRVRTTSNTISPRFLNWLIGSQRGKKYFLKSAKQTTGIASINMTQLKSFPLLLPPIALQEQFATRISKLEKLKASNIAALEKHNQLFASLQSQAFTGQL